MAYQNTPQTRLIDQVRVLVGDRSTSTSSELLADVEYDWMLSVTPNVYGAAALACESLVSLFMNSQGNEKQVGDLRLRRDAQSYKIMQRRFERFSALEAVPVAGGIYSTRTGMLTPHLFDKGMMDYPGSDPRLSGIVATSTTANPSP